MAQEGQEEGRHGSRGWLLATLESLYLSGMALGLRCGKALSVCLLMKALPKHRLITSNTSSVPLGQNFFSPDGGGGGGEGASTEPTTERSLDPAQAAGGGVPACVCSLCACALDSRKQSSAMRSRKTSGSGGLMASTCS